MPLNQFLQKLTGQWTGTCQVWFEPDKLADESAVTGEFTNVAMGSFVRHTYTGSMQGKPRHGEELLAFNGVTQAFQVAWADSFHMNYAILFSQGTATEQGFSVLGHYDVPNNPPWGWRTEFTLLDDDHLRITAYNVEPDGSEAKAVEVQYARVRNAS